MNKGTKHRKIMRNNIEGVTNPELKRAINDVFPDKQISHDVYDVLRRYIYDEMVKIGKEIVQNAFKEGTMTLKPDIYSFERNNCGKYLIRDLPFRRLVIETIQKTDLEPYKITERFLTAYNNHMYNYVVYLVESSVPKNVKRINADMF